MSPSRKELINLAAKFTNETDKEKLLRLSEKLREALNRVEAERNGNQPERVA
jgi:hypothetical protein